MEEGCSTQKQVLNYLGERFRVKLSLPDWYSNEQAAEFLFKYARFYPHCLLGLGTSRVLCVDVVGGGETCGLSSGLAKRASFVSVAIFITDFR